jgi:ketosteroid isomerase-like protein
MNIYKIAKSLIFILIISSACTNYAKSQDKKVVQTSKQLFKEIASMDSVMFDAFNKQDIVKYKSCFSDDLEWFQDNGGFIPKKTVFENFENNFRKENKLTSELLKGSLEVHPVNGYGAIEISVHKFHHMENGLEVTGFFKFLMIWQKKDGKWKVSRMISYDY